MFLFTLFILAIIATIYSSKSFFSSVFIEFSYLNLYLCLKSNELSKKMKYLKQLGNCNSIKTTLKKEEAICVIM